MKGSKTPSPKTPKPTTKSIDPPVPGVKMPKSDASANSSVRIEKISNGYLVHQMPSDYSKPVKTIYHAAKPTIQIKKGGK